MKKVITYIKWEINEGYKKNIYKYQTEKEQAAGYNKICEDLKRLISEGTILDYQVERN